MPDYLKEVIFHNSLRVIAVFCFLLVAVKTPLIAGAVIASSFIGVTLMAWLVAETTIAQNPDLKEEEDDDEQD